MATVPPATLKVDTKVTGAAVRLTALHLAVKHHGQTTYLSGTAAEVVETADAFAKFLEGGA